MKKLLFSSLFIATYFAANAQTIVSENFNSYTAGDVATDATGVTAGTSGYYIYSGAAADYQFATIDAAHTNSLKITSGASYSSTANTFNRFAFKDVPVVTPTAGNDIIKGSIEFYTGPATGAGRTSIDLYDATSGVVGIGYDYATKKIIGKTRLTSTATGVAAYYTITLTQVNTYLANTWVSVFFTYNKTTGATTWTTPEGTYSFSNAAYTVSANLDPVEYDFVSSTLTGNTVANQTAVDNFNLIYTNAAALSTKDVKIASIAIGVYPNPTTDFLNIQSEEKIKAISISDMSGRKMDVKLNGNSVDVRSLQTGTYLISIETATGKSTEKFIKK